LMQGADMEKGVHDPSSAPLSGLGGAGQPGTTAVWPPRSREDFVQAVLPSARAAAAQLGVDPEVVVAHAALETGWGRSMPVDAAGKPSFNLFGIKAGERWSGATADSRTQEFAAGRMQEVSASFRSYASPEKSVQDYVDFLKSSPRYATALNTGGDAAAFARGLQRGGYATDPDYVTKLSTLAAQLKSQAARPISPLGEG